MKCQTCQVLVYILSLYSFIFLNEIILWILLNLFRSPSWQRNNIPYITINVVRFINIQKYARAKKALIIPNIINILWRLAASSWRNSSDSASSHKCMVFTVPVQSPLSTRLVFAKLIASVVDLVYSAVLRGFNSSLGRFHWLEKRNVR